MRKGLPVRFTSWVNWSGSAVSLLWSSLRLTRPKCNDGDDDGISLMSLYDKSRCQMSRDETTLAKTSAALLDEEEEELDEEFVEVDWFKVAVVASIETGSGGASGESLYRPLLRTSSLLDPSIVPRLPEVDTARGRACRVLTWPFPVFKN